MSVKKAIRENIVLVIGVTLPVILIVAFWLATAIPAMLVAPPQYSLIYASRYYDYNNEYKVEVINQKLVVKVRQWGEKEKPQYYNPQKPELYLFDAKTMSTRPIPLELVPLSGAVTGADKMLNMQVQGTEKLVLDASQKAPDGYEYRGGRYSSHHGGGLVGELFIGGDSYYDQPAIVKNGRAIKLSPSSSYDTGFVGWVISQ